MVPGSSSAEKPQSLFSRVMTIVLCAAVGCMCLSVCGYQGSQSMRLVLHGTRTTGQIVDPEQHPKVGFTDGSGNHVVFTQNGFLVRPMGASVPVIYEARDPAGTARANTIPCMWWGVFWMLPLGLATLYGAGAGMSEWRQTRRSAPEQPIGNSRG